MKNLIMSSLIILVATLSSFAGTTINITCKTKAKWDGKDCVNTDRGLCLRISIGGALIAQDEFNGTISYDQPQNSLVLAFNKNTIPADLRNAVFVNGYFIVDETSPVSAEILAKIGYTATRTLSLNQGRYRYTIDGEVITVVIPC